MSQIDLADATGLSVVHVNRTIKVLQGLGVLSKAGRSMKVVDPRGGTGHIMISWSHLPLALQVMTRGAEKCAEVRKTLGKSNHLDASVRAFQLVQTVQVSDIDKPPLKILSLQNPAGLRCDFAIPTNTVDQLGRSIPRAIAEELLRDDAAERKKPM